MVIRIKSKKGQFQVFNLFTFMIVAILAVLLFGGLIYVMGLVNNVFHGIGVTNDANAPANSSFPCPNNATLTCYANGFVNYTQASDATFGVVNTSIQALRLVAITLIFGLAISIIVTNALVKVHPLWFFPYILIVLLAVFFAAPIANAYETTLNSNIYEGLLTSFTGANWIILNLPIVIAVIGILGGMFLFINLLRGGNETALIQ